MYDFANDSNCFFIWPSRVQYSSICSGVSSSGIVALRSRAPTPPLRRSSSSPLLLLLLLGGGKERRSVTCGYCLHGIYRLTCYRRTAAPHVPRRASLQSSATTHRVDRSIGSSISRASKSKRSLPLRARRAPTLSGGAPGRWEDARLLPGALTLREPDRSAPGPRGQTLPRNSWRSRRTLTTRKKLSTCEAHALAELSAASAPAQAFASAAFNHETRRRVTADRWPRRWRPQTRPLDTCGRSTAEDSEDITRRLSLAPAATHPPHNVRLCTGAVHHARDDVADAVTAALAHVRKTESPSGIASQASSGPVYARGGLRPSERRSACTHEQRLRHHVPRYPAGCLWLSRVWSTVSSRSRQGCLSSQAARLLGSVQSGHDSPKYTCQGGRV
jgi:hypothetical protein